MSLAARTTPLGSSRSDALVGSSRALRALRPTPHPRVCVCSLARIHLFIHTYIRASSPLEHHAMPIRPRSRLAVSYLHHLIHLSTRYARPNRTSLLLSSPPLSGHTKGGSSRAITRVPSRAPGSLHTSKHTDAQTGSMLPSPRLSQGPTACKAASAWRQWRRGRQRGMPPRRRRTSRIEHRPLRRRGGDMGVLLLRPTRSKLWFTCNSGLGARKGWSFASDLQRLRLVSSRRWALRSHLL